MQNSFLVLFLRSRTRSTVLDLGVILFLVTRGYHRLPGVTRGYQAGNWLVTVETIIFWFLWVTIGYYELLTVTARHTFCGSKPSRCGGGRMKSVCTFWGGVIKNKLPITPGWCRWIGRRAVSV